MIESRKNLRFALESSLALGVGAEDFRQNLDGDVAPKFRVAGAIHLTHPAFAQLSEDLVWTDAIADYHEALADWASARPRRSSLSQFERAEAGPPAPIWAVTS